MKSLRVGIIGAGGIVRQRHLPGLQALEGVEITAVCNARRESAEAFAREFGIAEVVASWRDLAARKDLDIVWIGAPPYLHAPATMAALEAGKHVFCQARMAMNLEEARMMREAARARPGQVTMLCPPPHGMRAGRTFQRLLTEGAIGELHHFRLQALAAAWTDPAKPVHFRQSMELSGLNMLTVGIYAEVLNKWLGKPRSLAAQLKVAVAEQGGAPVRVPDVVHVIGEWPGGLAGSLQWSGVARHAPSDRLEIYGSHGTLVYDFATEIIFLGTAADGGLKPVAVPPDEAGEWRVEEEFIDAVRTGGINPEPSFETGVAYMEVVDAIHRSAREERRICIRE